MLSTTPTYTECDTWESDAWARLPDRVGHGVISDCAVDADDRVYLASREGPFVLIYDRDGQFVTSWGQNVPGIRPHGIAIGSDGAVHIAFDNDHTVRKYTPDGEEIARIGVSGVASENGAADWSVGLAKRLLSITRGGPPFNGPTRVAIADDGDLFVSDGYGNASIHHFTPSGELVTSWGEPGSGPGQFYLPHGLGVTPDKRVLVADQQNDRVQVFTAQGDLLEIWTDLYHPMQIMVKNELIYVAEGSKGSIAHPNRPLPARVSVFDLAGNVVGRFGQRADDDPLQMVTPHGLAMDSAGNVYVTNLPPGHRGGGAPEGCIHKFTPIR